MKKILTIVMVLGLVSIFAADTVKVLVPEAQVVTEKVTTEEVTPVKAEKKVCHHKKVKHHKKSCCKKTEVKTEVEAPVK
jgi:hypothetical protein